MATQSADTVERKVSNTGTKCDICVSNKSTVTIENVVATYWQANSITGQAEQKLLIADGVILKKDEVSAVVKDVAYDSTLNPRYDHWSISFEFSGEKYQYKDKRCNISPEDNNKLITMKVTGSPKNGFTFHVDMPKSSSCSGQIS